MLVLSRKKDETIIINSGNDNIHITIVDIRGDKIRLGINAPPEVSIYREEVAKMIESKKLAEQNTAARN